MRAFLLKKFPMLYQVRVIQLRFHRHLRNLNTAVKLAKKKLPDSLPFTLKRHQSLLRRRLGASDPKLQENKITNLKISSSRITGFSYPPRRTESHLKGTIQSDKKWPYTYHVEERNHRFLKKDGKNYRQNEIWRKTINVQTGNTLKEELLISNFSEVKYEWNEVGCEGANA